MHFLVELRLHYKFIHAKKKLKIVGNMNKLKYVITILAALTVSSVLTANEVKMGKANRGTVYFQAEVYKQALKKMLYKKNLNYL
jgi:hypothetical protein